MQILEREDREFEEAMRGQVGTAFSSSNSSNKMGSFKNIYQDWYYCSVCNKKKVKIQTRPASKWHQILQRVTHYYTFSTYGLGLSLGAIKAALHLYEREDGPIPSKVSYMRIPVCGWYSPLLLKASLSWFMVNNIYVILYRNYCIIFYKAISLVLAIIGYLSIKSFWYLDHVPALIFTIFKIFLIFCFCIICLYQITINTSFGQISGFSVLGETKIDDRFGYR